jgi:glycyl-tRNA synthetase beta chain
MTNQSLLVELLTEELPPKALKKLGEAFADGIAAVLRARQLMSAASRVTSYATPRRLAVHITDVSGKGPDRPVTEKLVPVAVGLDAQGNATAALIKKLASKQLAHVTVAELARESDGKTEQLVYRHVAPGETLQAALQDALDDALKKLPIPKVMYYERDDGTPVNFVRPAHRLIALHGRQVLPVRALGLASGDVTLGHRFLSSGDITLTDADAYAQTLRAQGKVIASFAERRAAIEQQLQARAGGDEVIAPDALLDEVTALVEWPAVYECRFDEAFLAVPQECLILTMQTNQKYFATQRGGKLTHRFLIVSNIETSDPSAIIGGNERVVRPRLADAKFFFDQDRKHTLESRLPKLDGVVYHNKLGSQGERNKRVVAIAQGIARQWPGADVSKAARAARLSKADLVTDMVGEFPELQGVMGWYYARHDGEDGEVALAIREHYLPRFAGDALPSTAAGTVVALADKLETLAGLFSIDQQPTGDKDPFALRRHALGVIRMLIEKDLPLSLPALLDCAFASFAGRTPERQDALLQFMFDRLVGYLRDQGYSAQEVEAVVALRPERWGDIPKRLAAVRSFAQLPEAQALAAANKRIGNILKKADAAPAGTVSQALLRETAEKALHGALLAARPLADALFGNGEYTASLRELAALKAPVDAFFDQVMVNTDDAALRGNRLALLRELHATMNRVADLSKLAT